MLGNQFRATSQYLSRLLRSWFSPRSQTLLDDERNILEGAISRLPDAGDRLKFQQQLSAICYFERLHQNRLVRFHFESPADSLRCIPKGVELVGQPEWWPLGLAKLRITTGRRAGDAVVTVDKGLLYSLEFEHSPIFLENRDYKIISVQIGGDIRGYVEDIEREEHGDEFAHEDQ